MAMRKSTLPLLFSAVLFPIAVEALTTTPVGFINITVPPGRVQAVSLPLQVQSAFEGAVSAHTATSLTTNAAGWTQDEFGPFNSNPCVVRFVSGNAMGRYFKIASNTLTTVTLDTSVDLTAVVADADRYEIVAVDTLADLFGPTGTGLVTAVDPAQADNIFLREGEEWTTYYNDGAKWLKVGSDASQNNVAILPDQGFLIARRGATQLIVTITGRVPSTRLISELPGEQTVVYANGFPTDTTLNDLGLHTDANWLKGSDSSFVDIVQVRIPSGWLTYYHDGANWLRVAGGNSDQVVIPRGSAVTIVRRGSIDILHTRNLPYNLN
jgi:uncharacterized protein (TIGR02597 family)